MVARLLSVLVAGSLGWMGVANAQDNQLNIYNWAEYTAEDTIPGFERQTGIKVQYDTYDSNDTLQAKLLTGKSGYDIVVPSTHFAARQLEAGLFQKLDKSKIPNWANLDPAIMDLLKPVDPNNEYLVPWGYGTNALGINVTKAKEIMGADVKLNDWSLLFDPEKAKQFQSCGISVLDEAAQVFPAALHYIGKDPNSSNPDDYRQALEMLKKVRPYIRQFSSSGYIDELASGDLCLVYAYSGDVLIAADRAREAKRNYEIDFFLPDDGAPAWFDTMAVPADAPNPEAAFKFINYFNEPKVSADITNNMFYPNANKAARQFVVPGVANNPAVYPPPEVAKNLFVIQAQPLNIQRLQTRLWSELKSGR
ncbi:polyamine ABC transporter substrate-binding protein [Orrella daihaiensis]|uniref:Putrescine-binding periplasmic protein n=1 Tax=Orrella daihaiensis TaxID=2782176 RepID=A0ABY4APC4_9BURK|nr:polyamine ABC transporter substrate-binding protein [Orrella daihaiensis]